MKWFEWTSTPTGRRVMILLSVLVLLTVGSNPELLPLLSLIDAVGLDVLLWLLGAQFLAWMAPLASSLLPLARRVVVEYGFPATFLFLMAGCWCQLRGWGARLLPAHRRAAR